MEISAEKVRELREKSGAGIMDCKRALQSTAGDLSEAINFLRKEGLMKATKKAGRIASEGLIGCAVSSDSRSASLVEVNCETDFVARTDPFQEFLSKVSRLALEEKFVAASVDEELKLLIAKLGENMEIRRSVRIQAGSEEKVGVYLHAGSKIGAAIRIRGEKVDSNLCREIAMHLAAMNPVYLDRKSVAPAVVEKEKEILSQLPEIQEKPAPLRDKIVEGKLSRYFSETCLVEQPFIKDPTGKKTVGAYLKEKDPTAVIVEMVRFQVGENG